MHKPTEITVSVETALPTDQRDALRNLRNTLQSRHLKRVAAMRMVHSATNTETVKA